MKASKIPKYLMVTTGTMHPTDDSLAGDTDETIDDVVWYPSYFIFEINQGEVLESLKQNIYSGFLLLFPSRHTVGTISRSTSYMFHWENQNSFELTTELNSQNQKMDETTNVLNTFFSYANDIRRCVMLNHKDWAEEKKAKLGKIPIWNIDLMPKSYISVSQYELEKYLSGRKFKFFYNLYDGDNNFAYLHGNFMDRMSGYVKYAVQVEPIFI